MSRSRANSTDGGRKLTRRAFSAGIASLAMPLPARGRQPRLVATELDLIEALVSLDASPKAAVEVDRYQRLFVDTPLPQDCIDLGAAWEPNLERLQSVAPDLILLSSDRTLLKPMLDRIAPTALIEPTHTQDRYLRGQSTLRKVAGLLAVEHRAEALIERIDLELEDTKAMVSAFADIERPVFLVSLVGDGMHLEIYGRGCLLNDCLSMLGFQNAWQGGMPYYGWVITGLEAVAASPEATLVYLDFGSETRRTLALLEKSTLWRALPQVRRGRVHPVRAVSVWGGAPTAGYFSRRLARTFADAA